MNVTVFGGSQPRPGDADYDNAFTLGRVLGSNGYTVLTGGYIGSMEAVSHGAALEGAHVIGVTCDQIEAFRPGKPNRWVVEERRYENLYQRIMGLIEGCDAAIALPGGAGTLTEVALMWNLLLVGAISPRPLILIGQGWKVTFDTLFDQQDGFIPSEQRRWLSFSPDIHAAYVKLQEYISQLPSTSE